MTKTKKSVTVSIKNTTNYNIFKKINGNRNVNHAKGLKDSILNRNLLIANPIIVNEKMEVIDGQGRLEAVKMIEAEKKKKLAIYYIVIPGLKIDAVQTMNANSTNWGVKDYAKSYADRGNKHYINFNEFMKAFPAFRETPARMILTDDCTAHGKSVIKLFKTGEFEVVNNVEKATKIAETILDYKQFFDTSAATYRTFVGAIMILMKDKNFDKYHAEIIEKLKKPSHSTKLHGVPNQWNRSQYIAKLNDVLNSRRKTKVYLNGLNEVSIADLIK